MHEYNIIVINNVIADSNYKDIKTNNEQALWKSYDSRPDMT